MFNNYSYKVKFNALVLIFIFLGIAAYKRSYSSLIDVYLENRSLKEKIFEIKNKTNSFEKLKSEIESLNSLIGKEGISKELVQQGILSFVTDHSVDVSINNLESVHVFNDSEFRVYTNQLDLVGDYNSLNKLSYLFEKKFNLSKVVSLHYFTEKNNKTTILHLNIIFQNYESIN